MERGRTGQKYTFSTGYTTLDEIMDLFEEVSGRPRPKVKLPPQLMAGLAEVSSRVVGRLFPKTQQRFTPGAVRILRMGRHADLSKAREELGYEPTSVRQAIHEAYADFARRGVVASSSTWTHAKQTEAPQTQEARKKKGPPSAAASA